MGKKKPQPKTTTTYAPVWADSGVFHLHPFADRYVEKPDDVEACDGRLLTWVKVKVVPVRKKAAKRKGRK